MSIFTGSHTGMSEKENVAGNPGGKSGFLHGSCPNGLNAFLLLLLGASLLFTNRWFTEVDDECAIIDRAAQPILQTVLLYLRGAGEHEHPPLYDLILHGWLQLTRGEQYLLRLPAILFYLAATWVLAKAAKRQAGSSAQTYTVLLVVFWPYGFHFGRLAAWYSFCFLLVTLVTWNYFRYSEFPHLGNWCRLAGSAVLLLYSNYLAWALLGCLAIDYVIQKKMMSRKQWVGLAGTLLLLAAAYIPIARVFVAELHRGVQPSEHILNTLLNGIYDLYCLFVSESVAPWFWGIGVPVAVAIGICLLTTFVLVSAQGKRFLLYFVGLLAVMSLFGIANTRRMLFISPWLILPLSMALAQNADKYSRRILTAALLFIAAIGWYGIVSRGLYAAPHWIEPWEAIAQREAAVTREGGIVIGNNPSFFFYLTYDLASNGDLHNFEGLLPDSTHRANVYNTLQWLGGGRPLGAQTVLVKGPHFQIPSGPMDEAEQELDKLCSLQSSERLVHDRGAELKQRFGPETGQTPWRIEILTYACR
jgi:Dolichyl-phosphate-mannose-protein mannosyltransferase